MTTDNLSVTVDTNRGKETLVFDTKGCRVKSLTVRIGEDIILLWVPQHEISGHPR